VSTFLSALDLSKPAPNAGFDESILPSSLDAAASALL
jgi:hypothetical protein